MDPNETKPAVQSEVEETTQTDSPPVEEQTTDVQTTQETNDDHESQTTEEGDAVTEAEAEMSEKERKAFQEMRQERDRYKKELQARERNESAFDPFRPKPTVQNQPEVKLENYVNQETGEVDYEGYNKAIQTAISVASQNAQAAAASTAQSVADEQAARNQYPQVFDDPELEQEVADRWFAAQMRGEQVTISQIAGKVNSRLSSVVKKAGETARKQALNEVTEKEQAALSASAQSPSSSRQAQSAEDLENLRRRTRAGDEEAIAARLKGVPYSG